jgi:hypothetical protein
VLEEQQVEFRLCLPRGVYGNGNIECHADEGPLRGPGRNGKGSAQARCLSQSKENYGPSSAAGVILFPLSTGYRSSLHPFQSALKAGMKSMHAGKLYGFGGDGRPPIDLKTWNRYCFMSKDPALYQTLSRLNLQEQGEWFKIGLRVE